MHVVRGLRIEEMDDEELGALYVQLKHEQLTIETAKAIVKEVIAIDVELGLVSQEIESRDKFFTNEEKEKKELSPEEEAKLIADAKAHMAKLFGAKVPLAEA